MCFVEDSFVAGIGDPDHLGWVGRVAARTHRTGLPLTSYALGVRRQTSRDIAARWRGECDARLPPGYDGRVVAPFGVNDTAADNGGTRMASSACATYLDSVIHGALDAGWPALVIGPPPTADSDHNHRITKLVPRQATLAW